MDPDWYFLLALMYFQPRFAHALVGIKWNQTAVVGGLDFEGTDLPGEIVDTSNDEPNVKLTSKFAANLAFMASVMVQNGPNTLTFEEFPATVKDKPMAMTTPTTNEHFASTKRTTEGGLHDEVVILSEANPDAGKKKWRKSCDIVFGLGQAYLTKQLPVLRRA